MKISILTLVFSLVLTYSFSQESNLKNILKKVCEDNPSLLAELYFDKEKGYDFSSSALRSEYLLPSIVSSFKYKEGQLFRYNEKLKLLKASARDNKHYQKIKSHPVMIFKWEFDVKENGSYIIYQHSRLGQSGVLNGKSIINIHHNILSETFSGSDFIKLKAGKNHLFMLKEAKANYQLKVINKIKLMAFQETVHQKLTSSKPEDIKWVEDRFFPALASKGNGSSHHILKLFKTKQFRDLLNKDKETSVRKLVKILKKVYRYDLFVIDSYLYENHKDIYFTKIPKLQRHSTIVNNLYDGQGYRFGLIDNYIFTNQPVKAKQYIKDYATFLEKTDSKRSEEIKGQLYAQLWIANFYAGYFGKCNQMKTKVTKLISKFKAKKTRGSIGRFFTIQGYIGPDPKPSKKLIITDSTEKISALRLQTMIKDYKGDQATLKKSYEIFTETKYTLIDFGNDFYSMRNVFVESAKNNKKFLLDFKKLCQEKVKTKIKTAILKNDIEKIKTIIKKYGDLINLNELYNSLFKYYFQRGDFTKAHYYAKWIYQNQPNKKSHIAACLKLLEEFNHTPNNQKTLISKKIISTNVKFKGTPLKISKLPSLSTPKTNAGGLGSLIARVPLPKSHSQYTNHPILDYHQGAEVRINNNTLFISTASSLQAFDLKSKKIRWSSTSKNEYYNEKERGPHQKRFVSRLVGDKVLQFSNRANSSLKTVKCFDLEGSLLWDLAGLSNANLNPITTPILGGDSLFSLSYNGSGTFKTLHFDVLDPQTGITKSSIPFATIDPLHHDTYGGHIGLPWNTYRHDDHFIKGKNSVYGYTGTGVVFKANIITQELEWGKTFNKPNLVLRNFFTVSSGFAPSGFIKIFEETLVIFTPENQTYIGLNKHSGKLAWRSFFFRPQFIHGRSNKNYIYLSEHRQGNEPTITKLNPANGHPIWTRQINGFTPNGEGDSHAGKLYLPCDKFIIVLDEKNGHILQKIKMDIKPLKIRYRNGYWIIFTRRDTFILNADNSFNAKQIQPSDFPETGFIPSIKKEIPLPYSSITLEKSLYLPEKIFGTANRWAKNKISSTSLPYYHIMQLWGHITLFREGFEKSDGTYISPGIMWYEEIPFHHLKKDKIYISEPGEVRVENLFTRKVIWSYAYQSKPNLLRRNILKAQPVIVATDKYVAFQNSKESIRILEAKTGKHLFDFKAPKAKAIAICKNYVVVGFQYHLYCYDLTQFGKEIWRVSAPARYDLKQTADKIFSIEYNPKDQFNIYDLNTGKITLQLKRPGKTYNKSYREVYFKFDKNYIFAYYHLYDRKSGNLIKKHGEVHMVKNGGYMCFDRVYGDKGVYLEKGKAYSFKTTSRRDYDNPEIGFLKKGNKIILHAVRFIQTFEIRGDKLVEIDYIRNNAAVNGNHGNQRGMILQPLDNSLFELRDTQLFFFRNFDPHYHYQPINSFRVTNKSNSTWPHSELYPETKLTTREWSSNNKSKSNRTVSYQAFGDQKYAYLMFKLSSLKDKTYGSSLNISVISAIGQGVVTWDPDLWNHCTTNYIFNNRVTSWKELDNEGNTILYLKFQYAETFGRHAKRTLPEFSIEFRQYKNGIYDGSYRIGGAFYIGPKVFSWISYENNESQKLSNFKLRQNIYTGESFYPQGQEFAKWISDRRKLYSVKENITFLRSLIKKHKSNYCVINILTTLFMEEIELLRVNHPDLLEVDPKFKNQIHGVLKKVNQFATSLKIKEEWIQFALTIWTAEIYPRKVSFSYSRDFYAKSIYHTYTKGIKRIVHETDTSFPVNPLRPNLNIPFIEFFTPGLFTGYPLEKQILHLGFRLGIPNTHLGQIIKLTPATKTIVIDEFGKLKQANIKTSINSKPAVHLFNAKPYNVFELALSRHWISQYQITVPPVNIPFDKSYGGLNFKSIINTLNNLPTDSKLGNSLIHGIRHVNKITKKSLTLEQSEELYSTWLNRIKNDRHNVIKACHFVYNNLPKKADKLAVCQKIFKRSKLSSNIQRSFLLGIQNLFSQEKTRSVLGLIEGDLKKWPEERLDPTTEYSNSKKTYKFTNKVIKSKGTYFYLAIKITAKKRKKIYLISNVYEDNNNRATEVLSLWVNKRQVIDQISFREKKDHIISKKITLRKGENILLIKIENTPKGNTLRYLFGNSKGYPIKDITIEKFVK